MQLPRILLDHNRRVYLECARGTKWSHVVRFDPVCVYAERLHLETADRLQVYDYPFDRAVRKLVHGQFGQSITERARELLEEAMKTYLINKVSGEATVYATKADAQAAAGNDERLVAVAGVEDLKEKLTLGEMATVISKAEGRKAGKPKDKAAGAARIVKALEGEVPVVTGKGGKTTPKVTIGSICRQAILDGKTFEEAAREIKRVFPDAETTEKSFAWYRSQLKKQGLLPPKEKAASA